MDINRFPIRLLIRQLREQRRLLKVNGKRFKVIKGAAQMVIGYVPRN